MFRAPRVPRPSRPILMTIILTGLLAFPMGIALASHQFGDVPNSNPFHGDIDALVDNGVTAGCGNNNYCPKANVTREQMAAFMNRLGALAPGKTPVVNADRLDGYHASELVRSAGTGTDTATLDLTPTRTTFMELEIVAPDWGFLIVNASVTARSQACTMECVVVATLHSNGGSALATAEEWVDERASLTLTRLITVEPGTATITVDMARPIKEDGLTNGWHGRMTAIFVPFGAEGQPLPPS